MTADASSAVRATVEVGAGGGKVRGYPPRARTRTGETLRGRPTTSHCTPGAMARLCVDRPILDDRA